MRGRPGYARARRLALALALLLACAPRASAEDAAAAGDDARALEQVEQSLSEARARAQRLDDQAEALAAEVESLRRQSIKAASAVQRQEQRLLALQARRVDLEAEQRRHTADLTQRRRELAGVISALVRMPPEPARFLLFFPGRPLEMARGAMLLRTVTPALQTRADHLRAVLQALARAQAGLAAQKAQAAAALTDLQARRAELTDLMARRRAAAASVSQQRAQAQGQVERLAARARSLQALVERLAQEEARRAAAAQRAAAERAAAEPKGGKTAAPAAQEAWPDMVRPFPKAGPVNAPVVGALVMRYGQDAGYGQSARGVTIEVHPQARVVAPYDGRVAFAGPFREHGLILILEHRGQYHTVLAGLGRIDAGVGQWVLAGEPVGVMGGGMDGGMDRGRAPRLYLELRRNGASVDPLGWIPPESLG